MEFKLNQITTTFKVIFYGQLSFEVLITNQQIN